MDERVTDTTEIHVTVDPGCDGSHGLLTIYVIGTGDVTFVGEPSPSGWDLDLAYPVVRPTAEEVRDLEARGYGTQVTLDALLALTSPRWHPSAAETIASVLADVPVVASSECPVLVLPRGLRHDVWRGCATGASGWPADAARLAERIARRPDVASPEIYHGDGRAAGCHVGAEWVELWVSHRPPCDMPDGGYPVGAWHVDVGDPAFVYALGEDGGVRFPVVEDVDMAGDGLGRPSGDCPREVVGQLLASGLLMTGADDGALAPSPRLWAAMPCMDMAGAAYGLGPGFGEGPDVGITLADGRGHSADEDTPGQKSRR